MKTLLVLALLAGGGYYFFQHAGKPSPAAAAYEQFADLYVRGKLAEAKAFATGAELGEIEAQLQPAPASASSGSLLGAYQASMSPQALNRYKNQMISEIAGDVTGTKYKIESEEASSDGTKVTLKAVQSVSRYRTGDRVIGGGNVKAFHQTVEMTRDGDVWKVSAYKEDPA